MVEKGVGTSLGRELGLRRVARFSLGRGCAIVEVLVVLVKICVMVMFMFVPSPVTVRGAGGDGHAVSGRLSAQVSGSATVASSGRRRTSQRSRARNSRKRRRNMCTRNHQKLWPTRARRDAGRASASVSFGPTACG